VKQFVDLRVKFRDFCDILQALSFRAFTSQKYLFYWYKSTNSARVKFRDFCDILQVLSLLALLVQEYKY
jgi:hypothetical protein